jgi:hypothetical protein
MSIINPPDIEITDDKIAEQIREHTDTIIAYLRKRFLLTWLFMGMLAVMTGSALYLESQSSDKIDDNAQRLNNAIGAACEVGLASDANEPRVLDRLAAGGDEVIHKVCLEIVERVKGDNGG